MHHELLTSERYIKYVCCRRQDRASVAVTVVCSSMHPQSHCSRAAHRDLFSVCVRYDAANNVSSGSMCVFVKQVARLIVLAIVQLCFALNDSSPQVVLTMMQAMNTVSNRMLSMLGH
jgi:hypothetical protein